MRTIENDWLRVQVSDHGAELSAVFDKTNGRDVLWTADPAFWDRHAPILFPFVGRVYGNVYRYKGKEYPMGQHGFARDLEIVCTDEQAAELGHSGNRLADCLDAVGTQPPVFDVVEDSGETPLADQLFEGFSFCFIDDGADGVGA